MTHEPAIEVLAENALLLRFGERIDAATNARVHVAARALRAAALPGIIDIAPAYASLLVRFDPFIELCHIDTLEQDQPSASVRTSIENVLGSVSLSPGPVRGERLAEGNAPPRQHGAGPDPSSAAVPPLSSNALEERDIPVCYGGEYGPDLDAVAEHAGLAVDNVIARHVAAGYTVAMLGFAPGFPYMLGLDPALHTPRLATPRTRVPAGSIAVGGAQTGIYPRELPGGWNLIGRTPCTLFDPGRDPPCLLTPGDRVRFHAIGAADFMRLAGPFA